VTGVSSPGSPRGSCVGRVIERVWSECVVVMGEPQASDWEAHGSIRWRRDGGSSLPVWLFKGLPAQATPFGAIDARPLLLRWLFSASFLGLSTASFSKGSMSTP
jgi:hypothetical protein